MTISQVEAILKTLNPNDLLASYYKAQRKALLKSIPEVRSYATNRKS